MYAIGLTVQYKKGDQTVESKITGWNNHEKFDEIYLKNGDIIVDEQIIGIKEDYLIAVELTKQSLHDWLDLHPAISKRELAKEAGLHSEAISHLYNSLNRNISQIMKEKLIPVLKKYGWE